MAFCSSLLCSGEPSLIAAASGTSLDSAVPVYNINDAAIAAVARVKIVRA